MMAQQRSSWQGGGTMRARLLRVREDGQSLVEVAFALPVLLLLVVGIVELGNALNAHNVTINAVREGARFGSMGGSDTGIGTVVQGAGSALISYDESNSDLYVIRAQLTGTAPGCSVISDTFSCEPVFDTDLLDTQCLSADDMLARLDPQGIESCDLDVVAVDLYYRSPSLLGLPLVQQLSEAVPMRSLAVMRLESPRPLSSVCNAYPIAIHRSVIVGKQPGELVPDILNGVEDSQFGWLRWPDDPSGGSSTTLADSLERPTTSEFQNACDPDDTHLSIGDCIWTNTGVGNDIKVRDALDALISRGWIRVVVWDTHDDSEGANGKYHVYNFAIVELVDYQLPGTNTISVRFIRMDSTGCIE
jgi:hypothetical protein